ncbi:PilX N-terminal domain-containing pilus assembly protein [Methylophaga thalassica]|jgi:type IV pilus assembly protein PilX|uniref:pilus assembly PilX family protein n=1 Tax=Methylophaga thalassica TaxID=40223 RepID=UPI0039B63B29
MTYKQSGAALVVSLVMLLLLTMIGIFAMRTGVMEEKMTANQIDRDIAFKAAEIALRAGEGVVLNWANLPICSANGATGCWTRNAMNPAPANAAPWWQQRDSAWWSLNGTAVARPQGASTNPRYIIEEIKKLGNANGNQATEYIEGQPKFYRITARGVGGSAQSVVLLQTVVRMR